MSRLPIFTTITLLSLSALACSALPFSANGNTGNVIRRAESKVNISSVDAAFEGRIASIGLDRNIYIYQTDALTIPVTTDAALTNSRFNFVAYDHPTWSPGGWLSYVRLDRMEDTAITTILAERPGETDPITVQEGASNYIYGYWSPVVCQESEGCGDFAYLTGARRGISLNLARINPDTDNADEQVLSDGNTSLYYSWSPAGDEMLWNRNSNELSIYDVANDESSEIFSIIPGPFQAPDWSSTNRLLYAVVDEAAEEIVLTVSDTSGDTEITRFVDGTFFNWSPDGERVAFATGLDFPLNSVAVINQDGSGERQYNEVPNVIAFFWSPDSTKLAIVGIEATPNSEQTVSTLTQQPLPVRLVWFMVDVETEAVTRLASFYATPEQSYLLSFFDQYAQSHQVWSPDSRHIVYADAGPQLDNPNVFLVDTENPGEAPELVNEGVLGVFSFE